MLKRPGREVDRSPPSSGYTKFPNVLEPPLNSRRKIHTGNPQVTGYKILSSGIRAALSEAIPLIPLYACMAWTGTILPLPLLC
jgi:hypothetical protein